MKSFFNKSRHLFSVLFFICCLITIPVNAQSKPLVEDVWTRVDADAFGTYFWVGGASSLGSVTLVHEVIFFPTSNSFEFEIGPVLSLSDKIDVVPMVGFLMDITSGHTDYFMPQLYLYTNHSVFSTEIWNIIYSGTSSGTKDALTYYGRYIGRFAVSENFSIGPYAELQVDLADGAEESILSFPVGGILSFAYGTNNTLEFTLAVDTKHDNKFAPRVTFIHAF